MTPDSDQTFTITPEVGYQVVNVLVDGNSMGAVTSYAFTAVAADHEITVSFQQMVTGVVPGTAALALQGLAPNPVVSELNVLFSLPNGEPASLELFDATGRRLASSEVGRLGAGPHLVKLGDRRAVPSGIYWVRLTHGASSLRVKAVVVR